MQVEFDLAEAELVITSLEYTKSAFENTKYPSYEMKREKIDEVQRIITRIRKERQREKESV
jgi:hypothetical protein